MTIYDVLTALLNVVALGIGAVILVAVLYFLYMVAELIADVIDREDSEHPD